MEEQAEGGRSSHKGLLKLLLDSRPYQRLDVRACVLVETLPELAGNREDEEEEKEGGEENDQSCVCHGLKTLLQGMRG